MNQVTSLVSRILSTAAWHFSRPVPRQYAPFRRTSGLLFGRRKPDDLPAGTLIAERAGKGIDNKQELSVLLNSPGGVEWLQSQSATYRRPSAQRASSTALTSRYATASSLCWSARPAAANQPCCG